jgi:NAD(P)-dependent dehydrogenase (short-subunit alcohol dehydrogenase family)
VDVTEDVTDQVALVTGGGSGIGAGIVRMLAERGLRVVVADIADEPARALAAGIGGLAVHCDVRSLADNRAAVDAAVSTYGRLDVVVLNAGIAEGNSIDDFDEDAYRRAMGVNLDGVVFGLTAALPALRTTGGGRVLAVASLAGLAPVPEDPVYAANKAAVVNFVRSVGPALATEHILVNALCPGYTDTAILGRFRELLVGANWPLMQVKDVVAAAGTVLDSEDGGEAWLIQSGHPAQPYRFRGIPGPKA